MSKIQLIVLVVVAFTAIAVKGHGRMVNPASRSTLWRIPSFSANAPRNYDDTQLWCGQVHQREDPGTDCGVCGDPLSQARPRDNENGGKYGKGIITGRYNAGEVIEVQANITAAHRGNMEWRLCTNPRDETQDCFNEHVLQRADGQGSKVPVSAATAYVALLSLPVGVTCEHCVIQWNYRTGNNWGYCADGTNQPGCGPQETFRACSDVTIS